MLILKDLARHLPEKQKMPVPAVTSRAKRLPNRHHARETACCQVRSGSSQKDTCNLRQMLMLGRRLMSHRESNSLMAAVRRCETGRAGRLAVHLIMPLLREAGLKDGLIAVPGLSDGEPFCPSAGGLSECGKIRPVGGTEDLLGKGFGLARSAVARDDVFRCQLREAGNTRRNDG